MDIILGKTSGFCGGVTNSVIKSEELLKEHKKLYCLGELVHNRQVIDELKKEGMVFVDSLENLKPGNKVIIRAHGVSKEIYELAQSKKIELYDLTCPKVLLIHKKAIELVNNGYYVVLIGKKDHPETMGTISYCNEDSLVLENINDVYKNLEYIQSKNKIAVLCQTTYSIDAFKEIEAFLQKNINNELLIINTICKATEQRQREAKEISIFVDAMIIIGGKNSSNTKKLYDIAKSNTDAYIIETAKELDKTVFKYEKIGIIAGASTPQKSIDEVVNYLKKKDN